MHGRLPDDDAKRRETANKARYRALLKQGGKVLKLHIRDKNKFISALLNTRWLELSESEDWAMVAERASTMLNEFSETYGRDEPSSMDRQTVRRVPSSRS